MPSAIKIAAGLTTALVIAGVLYGPEQYANYEDRQTGDQIAKRIDGFESKFQRLPTNLEEVGVTEGKYGPYYQVEARHHYILWFGRHLGESYLFDSASRTWDIRH